MLEDGVWINLCGMLSRWWIDLSGLRSGEAPARGHVLFDLAGKLQRFLAPELDVVFQVADHAATFTSLTPAMLNLEPWSATSASSASQLTDRTDRGA